MPGGVPVGTLCLMDTRPRNFSLADEAALIDFGRWAERALGQGLHHDRLQDVVAALTPAPLGVGDLHVSATSVPYGDTSGDLHDWSTDGQHLTVTLADVMGKEQPAAILAAGIRSALRQHRDRAPEDAVRAVEPAVAEDLVAASAFATLFHARVALGTGAVEAVDAGHGLVVHLGADGRHRMLRSHDLPLGLHPVGAARSVTTVTLAPVTHSSWRATAHSTSATARSTPCPSSRARSSARGTTTRSSRPSDSAPPSVRRTT